MNIRDYYLKDVAPVLAREFDIKNPLAIPKVTRVVINVGVKEAANDRGVLDKVSEQLAFITGQRPKVTRAKKSIANFKLRQGSPVGLVVTLRGERMYDFLAKLFKIVLPRVRDFHGVSTNAFDRQGNYTLGLAEQVVFPEIDYAKVDRVRGLEISFVTTAGNATIAKRLLELMGMPFRKEGE